MGGEMTEHEKLPLSAALNKWEHGSDHKFFFNDFGF
jgi:hypothetical protein